MAVKQDLSKLSINQLSVATGIGYNTIKRRLAGLDAVDKDGRTLLYLTRDALAKIYGAKTEAEKERLDRVRADQVEFDLAVKRREYAPISVLQFAIADFSGQLKSALEGIPKRIKNSLPSLRAREIQILEREITKMQNAASEIQIDFDIVDPSAKD